MLCPLCRKEPESTIHALFFCEKILEVWWYWQTCPISLLAEKHDLIDIAMHILEVGTSHDLEVLFTTAWSVWYNRNQVVHESNGILYSQIWGYAQRLLCNYKGATIASFLSQQPLMLAGHHLLQVCTKLTWMGPHQRMNDSLVLE